MKQSGGDAPVFSDGFRRDFAELLRWRRDVRRFRTDPVPEDKLNWILSQADMAPSVGNSQPWRIVHVANPQRRQAVVRNFEAANAAAARQYDNERAAHYLQLKLSGLKEAPVHLAVFSDEDPAQGHGLGRSTMQETLAYSTVSMINFLWLAARIEGIGVGWVSILDPDTIAGILEVDASWRLVAYLCVGYPVEEHVDPELERERWQVRSPLQSRLYSR